MHLCGSQTDVSSAPLRPESPDIGLVELVVRAPFRGSLEAAADVIKAC